MLNGQWIRCCLSFCGKGQQSHDAGTLDCHGQITLVLGAHAGHAAGQDLPGFGDEALKLFGVLIIDAGSLFNAELANLASASSGTGTHFALFHGASLLLILI